MGKKEINYLMRHGSHTLMGFIYCEGHWISQWFVFQFEEETPQILLTLLLTGSNDFENGTYNCLLFLFLFLGKDRNSLLFWAA